MTVNEFMEIMSAATKRVDIFDRDEGLIATWNKSQGLRSWHGKDFGECDIWYLEATGCDEFEIMVYDTEMSYEESEEYNEEFEGDGLRLEPIRERR